MLITVLGSGTSFGVPSINCTCPVCTSQDPRDDRTRASIWITDEKTSVVVDTATDFRRQALREKIPSIDGLLITHCHADHVHGLDDIRPYTIHNSIPVYGNTITMEEFKCRFSYIFKNTQQGGGKPRITLNCITDDMIASGTPIRIKNLEFTAIPMKHGELKVLGYRTGKFAYLTDCSEIPEQGFRLLEGVEFLVLDALRYRPHPTHFTIEQAMEASKRIGAQKTWFTHLCHDVLHNKLEQDLPYGFAPAYDGLKIKI